MYAGFSFQQVWKPVAVVATKIPAQWIVPVNSWISNKWRRKKNSNAYQIKSKLLEKQTSTSWICLLPSERATEIWWLLRKKKIVIKKRNPEAHTAEVCSPTAEARTPFPSHAPLEGLRGLSAARRQRCRREASPGHGSAKRGEGEKNNTERGSRPGVGSGPRRAPGNGMRGGPVRSLDGGGEPARSGANPLPLRTGTPRPCPRGARRERGGGKKKCWRHRVLLSFPLARVMHNSLQLPLLRGEGWHHGISSVILQTLIAIRVSISSSWFIKIVKIQTFSIKKKKTGYDVDSAQVCFCHHLLQNMQMVCTLDYIAQHEKLFFFNYVPFFSFFFFC